MQVTPRGLIDWARRRAGGQPVRSTLVLIALFGLIGSYQALFVFDWAQQAVAARINKRSYRGDIVVVAFDRKTAEAWGHADIAPARLAQLVDALGAMAPRQLVIDRLPLTENDPRGSVRLAEALQQFSPKPTMFVSLAPKDTAAAGTVLDESDGRAASDFAVGSRKEPFWRAVEPASWISWGTPFGAPNGLPQLHVVNGAAYPSLSQVLASARAPVGGDDVIDVSLDPRSVPMVSAADVLSGAIDRSRIAGRRILVSSTVDAVRDSYRTPHSRFSPRAYLIVAGADTLARGPQRDIGWIPAYLLAVCGALGWLVLRRPWGRIAMAACTGALLVGPLLLERQLVYQQAAAGLFLLLAVAVAHGIGRVRASLALARNAVEAKSWFLAQASHDLRQPIHAIGMLSARLGQTDLSPDQAELIGKIDRSVDGASRMFQSLLDIATIDSGSLKPVIGAVGVDELLSDIEGQNALAAERAGVDLRFVPSGLILLTDRSLITTVLQNVVSNAIKYASGKKIVIGCRKRGGTAMLCVYDRGVGIQTDDLRQVTQAFFRASRAAAGAEGAGLGLTIVHRLAELLGLTLTIRSRPDHGTGVVIAGLRLTDRPARPTAAPVVAAATSPLSGLKVLLVDDDLAALRAMEPLLDQWGCHVTATEQFPAIQSDFHAIVSDFDFGKGITLAQFRAPIDELVKRGTVVVVISGHAPAMVRRSLGQDRLLVLAKPVRPAELRAALLSAKLRAAGQGLP
jgi:signal transduction histidine kinase